MPKLDEAKEAECLAFVRARAERGNAESVVSAIDEFAYTSKWMMNVGDVKGKLLRDALVRAKPALVLELGAYVGYSSISMACALPKHAHIYTIEKSSKFAAITKQMIEFAGLEHKITVILGTLGSESTVRELETLVGKHTLDFVFLDHWKEAYLPDLNTILKLSLLHEGSVCFADNCLYPGAPDYVAFMDNNPHLFKTIKRKTLLEYKTDVEDMVLESVLLAGARSKF